MLTFTFSGVDGSMTDSEILTSGMVGKEAALIFDDSWAQLTKTVVFRAGDTTRVVTDAADTVVIPEEVLARPFARLYVGVYGTDAEGTVVIPTIMAEGPMIRYGADPIEDETAKDLPVWQNLQDQIGDLTALETESKENLVSAINEIHGAEDALISRMDSLEEAQAFMGDPALLETEETATLVGAVNEVNAQVGQLLQNVALTVDAAQLLVDILSKGLYTSEQAENIDALAALLGVTVTEDLSHLILYWDFRTGSLTDRIAGLEAVTSEDVTLDTDGAHVPTNTSYITLPAGLDGASLAGHTAEIKFGEMTLSDTASTMRLLLVCNGAQPASMGLQWNVQDCWSKGAALVTEFTDLNMFSGKTLVVKANGDASQLDYYFEDQLIVSVNPGFVHSHLSIGSTANGAFPLTVEYVRIYPTTQE